MTGASTEAVPPEPRSTLTRIIRVLSVGLGVSGLLFLTLLSPSITAQWSAYALWWNVLSVASLLAVSIALCIGSAFASPLVLRRFAAGSSLWLLLVTAITPLAAIRPVATGQVPWILDVIAVPTTLAAVGFTPIAAWGATAVAAVVAFIVRTTVGFEQSWLVGLENMVQTATFCAVFVLLGVAVLQAGSLADRTLAAARTETALAVSARARTTVRERIDALVHDRVLATLLLAGRARSKDERVLAASHAADALEELARQADPEANPLHTSPRDFVWAVQGLVRDLDPEAQFSYELLDPNEQGAARRRGAGQGDAADADGGTGTGPVPVVAPADASDEPAPSPEPIPADIVEAVTAATLEALRNSLRHAGDPWSDTLRAVHVRAGADRVEVTVIDDGVGFDVGRVVNTRLGIDSSIRSRMRAVGGTSQIVSRVGQGTRVVVGWERPIPRADADVPQAGRHAQPRSGLSFARVARSITPFDLDFWTVTPSPEREVSETRGSLRWSALLPEGFGWEGIGRGGALQAGPLLVFAGLQILTVVVLSLASDMTAALSWSNVLAVLLYAVTVTVLALPGSMPIHLETGFAVIFSCLAISMLVPLTLPHGEDPGYQAWHFGANTVMLLVLGLRGRIGLSWLGMLGMSILTVWWCASAGFSFLDAVGFLIRNIATLSIGSGVALLMRTALTRTLVLREEIDYQYSVEAAELAAAEEQGRILQRFEAAALPALRRIATGVLPAPEEQRDWLTTEAMLRDRIRARALDVDPLRSAVHGARERGLRVVLLDDARGRSIPADELQDVLTWAAERVERAIGPELTVRLRVTAEDVLSLTVVGEDVSAERRIGESAEEGAAGSRKPRGLGRSRSVRPAP